MASPTERARPEQALALHATSPEQLMRPVPRAPEDARAFALAPGVWSLILPLPYPGIRSVNAYLLELAEGVALIDCGSSLKPGWDALRHAVAETGHDVAEIRLLVCTHMHTDHAGLAHTVAARTGCRLARGGGPADGHDAFRNRLAPLDDRRRRAVREGVPATEVETLIGPLIADDGRHTRATFDRVLAPGERLPATGGAWEVIPAQGHAASQIALFEPGRRWLISADLVAQIPMLEYGSMEDPVALHRASLDRVVALEPERLLPGHGRPIEPVSEVRERLLAARDALDQTVERAASAIAQRPRSGYELSELVDPDNRDLVWRQGALSLALCVLEHLEIRGRAASATGADGVRRFAATRNGRP